MIFNLAVVCNTAYRAECMRTLMIFFRTALNTWFIIVLSEDRTYSDSYSFRSLSRRKKIWFIHIAFVFKLRTQTRPHVSRAGARKERRKSRRKIVSSRVCAMKVFLERRKSDKQRVERITNEESFSSNITQQPAGDPHSTSKNNSFAFVTSAEVPWHEVPCVCVLINIFYFLFSSPPSTHTPTDQHLFLLRIHDFFQSLLIFATVQFVHQTTTSLKPILFVCR